MAQGTKHVDLNIQACKDVDLSMKHGKRLKSKEIQARNTNKASNMLKKKIKHVIQEKKSKINARK